MAEVLEDRVSCGLHWRWFDCFDISAQSEEVTNLLRLVSVLDEDSLLVHHHCRIVVGIKFCFIA